jgi:hypothetical protein
VKILVPPRRYLGEMAEANPDPVRDADAWREAVSPTLVRLRTFEFPGLSLDLSVESLDALEAALLEEFPAGAQPPFDDLSVVGSATAYLGEALMRVAGGGWRWDDGARVPLVVVDPALDAASVSPYALLRDALSLRTGTVLRDRAEALRAATAERQATHPGWAPTKEHTPAVDELAWPAVVPGSPLDAWIAEGARLFARDAAHDPRWDFSLASLDQLEAEVIRRVREVDELADAEQADFVHWAHWYGGEVVRRIAGGTWAQFVDDPAHPSGTTDLWAGRPFLADVGPRKEAESPYVLFRVALRTGRRGVVRERLERLL